MTTGASPGDVLAQACRAYRRRWRRRGLLWRSFRSRRALRPRHDRTAGLARDAILAFAVVRNEALRLPFFLDHYRRLGIDHFLIVDNDSDDGTTDLLAGQPDVSLWTTGAGYRAARFGVDWITWLLARHGSGRWCLTVDADELLVYPYWQTRDLRALTGWLDACGRAALPAMMLDLYPRGPIDRVDYRTGDDPLAVLGWCDSGNLTLTRQAPLDVLWIQGGPRARAFFADAPRRAPTLGKLPLVRWHWRYAYVNSTHSLLPRRLNRAWDDQGGEAPSGLLLHTKFLPQIVPRAVEEKARQQHFNDPSLFDLYYDRLAQAPDFWTPASTRIGGWRHLESLGLMSRGGWA